MNGVILAAGLIVFAMLAAAYISTLYSRIDRLEESFASHDEWWMSQLAERGWITRYSAEDGGGFRWKTLDEIIAAQQQAQQDRFRELWGNAVCRCEETND